MRGKPGRKGSDALSFSELRQWYDKKCEELEATKHELRLTRAVGKSDRSELVKKRAVVKAAEKTIVTLTESQKAADEATKAGAWSGAAAISITILYETWKVIGFPGGSSWQSWWQHESVYGVMMWSATCMLGIMYKLYKNG